MSYPTPSQVAEWQAEVDAMSGAEQLRAATFLMNNCCESYADDLTAEQLILVWRAYRVCGWDITPDDWSPEQLSQALRGELVTGLHDS